MENSNGEKVKVGILTIYPAVGSPVQFEKFEYVRVGSATKKMVEYPGLQSRLWAKLHGLNFETQIAISEISLQEVLDNLNVSVYYERLAKPSPISPESIAEDLIADKLIFKDDIGHYSITNLAALLFAKKLSSFKNLERKTIRIIQHKGIDRSHMLKDETFDEGYAVCFEKIEQYLKALLPSEEHIGDDGIRRTINAFPLLAIREAIGNIIVHQDMTLKGSSLLIEVFDNRIEFTNPGTLIVDVMRLVDTPPVSRNEKLARLMRRLKICEEAGSGWDKIVSECEKIIIPAPKVLEYEENTRVIIRNRIPFSQMSLDDKVWASYLHACVQFESGLPCTNSSIRKRFGLKDSQQSQASRLIKECVSRKIIKPLDQSASPKYKSYIPYWVL